MSNRLGAIGQLALARFRLFYREPGTMFWTFGFPLVISIVLGMAFRNQRPEPVFAAIEDGPGADHLREILDKSDGVQAKVMGRDAAHAGLRTGKVSIVVVAGAPRTYRFDPTRPESRLARAVLDDALQRGEGRVDPIVVANEIVTEPGSRYIDFLIPGLIGLGLMSSGLWGIGFALAEMRTKRLLKRLVATPMRRSDFLFSFLLVRALLLFVELPPLLIFAYLAFSVGVNGSFAALGLVALTGALVFAVMGLLLASRAENPQIVSGLINVVSFPMYLCSGVFFSSSRFPEALLPVIRVLPLTALNDAIRAVMIDGVGVGKIVPELAILAAWGIVSFTLALKLFRWR